MDMTWLQTIQISKERMSIKEAVLKNYRSYSLQENFTHSKMAQIDMEELVVRLEESLELSNMEHGVKLVGSGLTQQNP